ncbi:prepilin peptidase [Caulobacter mirabilis]|nr:A24 family peptidase [Caulobacter mirabilis]
MALKVALILLLAGVLTASSIVDARSRRLPDPLTLAVALLAVALAALDGWSRLATGLAAGVVTFLVLEGVRRGFMANRGRPGLGQGDVKLFAALALWLGLATPWAVALASALGLAIALVVRPADGRIPFGPAIAVAALGLGVAGEMGWSPLRSMEGVGWML